MSTNISYLPMCCLRGFIASFRLRFFLISFIAFAGFGLQNATANHVMSPADIPENTVFFDGEFRVPGSDALKRGPEPGKLSLVKFYTDYCFPCDELDRRTFRNKSLRRYVSRYFNAYKVDGFDKEKGGRELAWEYKVHTFPTILVTDPKGKELLRITGNVSAEELQSRLSELESVASHMRATTRASAIPVLPASNRGSGSEPLQQAPVNENAAAMAEFGLLIRVAPDYYEARKLARNFTQNLGNQIWIEPNKKGSFSLVYGAFATRKEARKIQQFFLGWEEARFRIQSLKTEGVSY